jgi:hypothetical protein
LLQPLDVACFSPLKRGHGDEISALARSRINYISKETFLPASKSAYYKAITAGNTCSRFRATGLVPNNPDAVLSKLDVRLRTPTPPQWDSIVWEAKTPHNAREVEEQSMLLRNCI